MIDGERILVAGASGSGKTLSTRVFVAKASRLIVWDPKGKWAQLDRCKALTSRKALIDEITRLGSRPGRLAFISMDPMDFDYWAECAFTWGQWGGEHQKRTSVVAEETGNVTHPGKAPRGYHLLISQSREYGVDLYALTQRPAESDKTILGNVTRFRVFALHRDLDRRAISRELDCDPAMIGRLKPLEYLERDVQTGVLRKFRAIRSRNLPKWREVPL